MKITTANLIRWAGLSAMGSGLLFIAIQGIHPLDLIENVSTTQWTIVHYMGVVMGILGIFGLVGLYGRQVEEAGWLGLAGYLLLSFFYIIATAFQFIEAFVSPLLASPTPQFVEGILAIAAGQSSTMDMGALPLVYMITGLAGYLLGGLLFGIATFRAGVLPRWAGALLAISVVLPLITTGLLPHPLDRILAIPMASALIWMGYALWSERRVQETQAVAEKGSLQLQPTVAE